MNAPVTEEQKVPCNATEFRALLDWRMCSDPFPPSVPIVVIDDWIERVCRALGYVSFAEAYHSVPDTNPAPEPDKSEWPGENSRFGVGA